MWEKVVGPALEDINPALNPKNSAEVDLLLAAEIYMYVNPPQFSLSTCIICIMCIMCIICVIGEMCITLHTLTASVDRLKSDGTSTSKKVKVLGKGLLTLVDHVFWNLPFANLKQSHTVRKKANVTEKEWADKWEEIVAEHDLPGAREQLASGWKEYLESHGAGQAGAAGVPKPASLSTLVLDD